MRRVKRKATIRNTPPVPLPLSEKAVELEKRLAATPGYAFLPGFVRCIFRLDAQADTLLDDILAGIERAKQEGDWFAAQKCEMDLLKTLGDMYNALMVTLRGRNAEALLERLGLLPPGDGVSVTQVTIVRQTFTLEEAQRLLAIKEEEGAGVHKNV